MLITAGCQTIARHQRITLHLYTHTGHLYVACGTAACLQCLEKEQGTCLWMNPSFATATAQLLISFLIFCVEYQFFNPQCPESRFVCIINGSLWSYSFYRTCRHIGHCCCYDLLFKLLHYYSRHKSAQQ